MSVPAFVQRSQIPLTIPKYWVSKHFRPVVHLDEMNSIFIAQFLTLMEKVFVHIGRDKAIFL